MNTPLKSLSIGGLREAIRESGLPAFRANQILEWVYSKRVSSYDEMTNLPKALREQFSILYPLYLPDIKVKQVSKDGSRKYLLEFHDQVCVETVGLPSDDERLTVCVSSQAGCSMACDFCATGKLGLMRNLQPGEIVDQVMAVEEDFGRRVTNVVVMGQGEPFANYDSTIEALRIINNPKLINIGARHITVSTCGILKGIEKFSHEEEQFTHAVSLHAARQELRDKLMPTVRNMPLHELRDALLNYEKESGRRYSFEYALMKGVNDSDDDLEALVHYCKPLLCHVNLIPLNKIKGARYNPVPQHEMKRWKEKLEQHGIPASIRKSRGSDIDGACGQLCASQGNG